MIVDANLAPVDSRKGVSPLHLSVARGLTQSGAHPKRLPPGARPGFWRWHQAEDELVLLHSGSAVLMQDSATALSPGDMVCWPAGQTSGHQMENRSAGEGIYLTLGTRLPRNIIHYPDHDLITHKDGTTRRYTHADGRARSAGERK